MHFKRKVIVFSSSSSSYQVLHTLCSPVRRAFSYGIYIRHISLIFNKVCPYDSLNHNGICRIPYEHASRKGQRNLCFIFCSSLILIHTGYCSKYKDNAKSSNLSQSHRWYLKSTEPMLSLFALIWMIFSLCFFVFVFCFCFCFCFCFFFSCGI